MKCSWTVIAPTNTSIRKWIPYSIVIRFDVFELEYSDTCNLDHDSLHIYDGPNRRYPLMSSGQPLCGRLQSTSVTKDQSIITSAAAAAATTTTTASATIDYSSSLQLLSNGKSVHLKFISDAHNEHEFLGFSISLSRDVNECLIPNHTRCQHSCVNTVTGFRCECYPGYQISIDGKSCIKSCGRTIKFGQNSIDNIIEWNGTISSMFDHEIQHYDHHHPKQSKNCIWNLEAPKDYRIVLNFTKFNLNSTTNIDDDKDSNDNGNMVRTNI